MDAEILAELERDEPCPCTLLGPDRIEVATHEVTGILAVMLRRWSIVSLTAESGREYTYISRVVPVPRPAPPEDR